ncbi:MAG: SurA N-terminal domain-containing protein [Deltaproteobacteria bacterium]|jgi:peptidyl-prolyl cis-trans isomerase D|nr:SurA N-terminal domain-containing protein [Deltaproteobacteria bacterium]
MLNYIRKRTGSIFSIMIIGAIALVFIFWGIGGQDSGSGEDIKLDGQAVSANEYSNMLNNVLEQVRDANPGVSLSQAEEIQARRQALAYLVQRHSLLTLARSNGLEASVAEINRAVKANPSFWKPNSSDFDLEIYQTMVPLRYNMSLAAFEAAVAQDIVLEKTTSLIQSLSFAPTNSVMDDYHFASDKLTLDYAYFPDSAFPIEEEPTEDALSAYYEVNKENWRSPARVKVEYVEVDIEGFLSQVEAAEDEIVDMYNEEKSAMTTPEQVEASHILLRFPNLSPTEEEKAATRAAAMAALERTKTEDFKTLAGEISQDANSAVNGGSLGTITRGQTLPAFEETVFGPGREAIGQVMGPIETLFGYHLIVVDSYQPAHEETLEEAREKLTDLVVRRKARRLAVNRLEDLIEALPISPTPEVFVNTAKSLDFEPKETDFFSDASDAPAIFGNDSTSIAAAADMPVGLLSDPIDTPEHLVLYMVIDKQESFLRPLEDETVRPEVAEAWKAALASQEAEKSSRAFLEATRAGTGSEAVSAASADSSLWDSLVKELPEEIDSGRTEPFERLQFYASGKYLLEADPASLIREFFKLGQPGDMVSQPIRVDSAANKGYLVFRLAGVEAADESSLTAADLANRQVTASATLGEAGLSYWSASRSGAVKIQLPQALQNYISGRDFEDDI